MLSQLNISATTPTGATLVAGGATFRIWAASHGGLPERQLCRDDLRPANGRPSSEQGRRWLLDRFSAGCSGWRPLPLLGWWLRFEQLQT